MNTKTLVGHKIPSALIDEAPVLAPLAVKLQLEAARVGAEVARRAAQRWLETAQLAERSAYGQTTVRRALRRVG